MKHPTSFSTTHAWRIAGRRSAPLAASLAVLLLLEGCIAVATSQRHPRPSDGAAVALRVYADDDGRAAGRTVEANVVSTLERRDGNVWKPVFRSLDGHWTVGGLTPGKYRVRISGVIDDEGELEEFGEVRETVHVASGEIAEIDAVVEHLSPALVGIGIAAAVVAAVALHDVLDDVIDDLPVPDLPIAAAIAADVIFTIATEQAGEEMCCGVAASPAPFVTSTFPRDGATVASPRPRLVVALSEPIRPGEFDDATITVVGATSGPIPGRVGWEPGSWWLTWTPEADLPPGESFTVRVDAEGVVDLDGHELDTDLELAFATPGSGATERIVM